MEVEAFASLIGSAGLPVLRVAGAACVANPSLRDETMMNRVDGLGLERPSSDAELDEIDGFFRSVPTRYAVAVSPLAEASLAERLRERGFEDGYAWMKFRRGVEPAQAPATDLVVRTTGDGATFGRIVAAAFGMPPEAAGLFAGVGGLPGWTLFLALDGDEPVGAAALFAHDRTGWLGMGATLAEHRGKGAQGALLAARIAHARELGLDELATETGERLPDRPSNSYRNILRAGFAEAYLRPNLVSPAGPG